MPLWASGLLPPAFAAPPPRCTSFPRLLSSCLLEPTTLTLLLHSTTLVSGLLPEAREGSGCPSCSHSFSLNAYRVLLSTHELPTVPAPLGPCLCPCEILSVSVTSVCDTWEFVIKYSPQMASLELWNVKRFTWLITFFKEEIFLFIKS